MFNAPNLCEMHFTYNIHQLRTLPFAANSSTTVKRKKFVTNNFKVSRIRNSIASIASFARVARFARLWNSNVEFSAMMGKMCA